MARSVLLEGSDRDIVEACRLGDRDAFRALFESYKDKVYSIALRFSGDRNIAMDIAQDTFLKLFSSIADFRGASSFETWIYRLVVNSCLDHKRKSWRLLPLLSEFAATLRASTDSLSEVLRDETRSRIRSAVDDLAPDLRITVILRYTEGLSYDQIGEVLGCSSGTVGSRLNRAHKLLERRLSHLVTPKGGRHV